MDTRRMGANAGESHPSSPTGDESLSDITYTTLFEALCQTSPDAVVVAGVDGTIVFSNQRCFDLLGYEPQLLVGRKVEKLVPHRFEGHKKQRENFQKEPSARHMGTRPILTARHKNGEDIPVDISLSTLALEGIGHGGITRFTQAVIRDAAPRWEGQQEELVRNVAMNSAANGIVITDTKGVIQWVNPAVSRMTGYTTQELLGQHTRILKSGEHDPAFYKNLWETISRGKTWYGDISNLRKDGSLYCEEQHISPVRREDGTISHYIAIKQDVTARKEAERKLAETNAELTLRLQEIESLHQQLREEAIRDPLTGLFNRRYLRETLVREISRAQRENIDLGILALDLDHFKNVNDSLGHAAGDEVPILLADLLKDTIRQSDMACRMGGDEFLVVMPQMAMDMAQKRGREWLATFQDRQKALPNRGGDLICTLSIGITNIRPEDEGVDEILKRADDALYRAKREGRARVVCEN
jgi:diguanylate cyclase (GGDEF)-like protein/PAS domain S-box-containing protein